MPRPKLAPRTEPEGESESDYDLSQESLKGLVEEILDNINAELRRDDSTNRPYRLKTLSVIPLGKGKNEENLSLKVKIKVNQEFEEEVATVLVDSFAASVNKELAETTWLNSKTLLLTLGTEEYTDIDDEDESESPNGSYDDEDAGDEADDDDDDDDDDD